MNELPIDCYQVKQIREFEQLAIKQFSIPAEDLMKYAGTEAFNILQSEFPAAKKIAVMCGTGNNAGDGYVLARLANQAGLKVTVFYLGNPEKLPTAALQAYQFCLQTAVNIVPFSDDIALENYDLIVDALLGIGIKNEVSETIKLAIDLINKTNIQTLAIDIPSGLDADTGYVLGSAVKATATITFIGVKQGLLTAQGPEYCGKLFCHDLHLSQTIFKMISASASRLDWDQLQALFLPRPRNSHKGNFGHVLVIGGDYGMPGAVHMAAEAASRVGAGLVSIATRPEHIAAVVATRPELMCHGIKTAKELTSLIQQASVIVIGPGLGESSWSEQLWESVLASNLPLVVDASALNLLAKHPYKRDNWILTPHPGEAAKLLGTSSQQIQRDRFTAAKLLYQKFGGVIVLKGAGTIVLTETIIPSICSLGNPGMASAGMGDVLSGILGGLVAQQFTLKIAAELGVALHAKAGDLAAAQGERGLLASDLITHLRELVN